MGDSISNGDDPCRNDPRSVDELISAALSDSGYDAGGWNAVAALHWRGSEEALERATELCQSACAVERRVGADILGQLGVMERAFPKEGIGILLKMLRREHAADVLDSVLIALGHYRNSEAIGPVSRFRHNPNPDVRYAAVHALTGHDDPLALNCLIELTRDEDPDVRDWATFGLGKVLDVDTPTVRDALVARLTDPDDDTRGEALVGLAKRGDRRVIPALLDVLQSDLIGSLAIEAAEIIDDPQVNTALAAAKSWLERCEA